MNQPSYPYKRVRKGHYTFVSDGIRKIGKAVKFEPTYFSSYTNLVFGEARPGGSIDDRIISNNGDLKKVIYTVISIIKDYTESYPQSEIYFCGSTPARTRLYRRIIKMYYQEFAKEFMIKGLTKTRKKIKTDLYDPEKSNHYFAFAVSRFS